MEEVLRIINILLEDTDGITANRMSIINGKTDFTEYGSMLADQVDVLMDRSLFDIAECDYEITNCIIKIILAEISYQKDDCYNALILINSALAFLEKEGHEEIWMAARYIQMCIMIVTGQLHAIYPLVGGMRDRIYASENVDLIRNYDALCAWCALYDDDWDTIENWMKNKAPNEFAKFDLKDTFTLFIKARIYYMQGQNLAAITLMQSMEMLLKENERYMELCEMNMIISMAMAAENHMDEAYVFFEKCLKIAEERYFLRLLADEGEPIYRLTRAYTRNVLKEERDSKYVQNLKKKSKEMALMYPRYLRNHKQDFPKLTERETDILKLLVDGRSNTEIADFFGSSPNTIKYHMKNLFRKLGVNSRERATKAAIEEHLIR